MNEKSLNVYYMNWSQYSDVHKKQEVLDLPWDRVSTINHAFWRIEPNDDYTEFGIGSFDAWADIGAGNSAACFPQYEKMHAVYPEVKVVLSIGGWSHSTRDFSLMAESATKRASFISACIETLRKYPFLGGIDLDWEYPGTHRNHEGEAFTGSPSDRENFTALLKEMREAFDQAGMEDKIITYCASTDTTDLKAGTIAIDFAATAPYVDRINIMTYDMVVSDYTDISMHHTALHPGPYAPKGASAAEAAEYLLSLGVPAGKINIGSPLYSYGWIIEADSAKEALGKPVAYSAPGALGNGSENWFTIKQRESEPGWEMGYDEESQAAYLFNADPDSIFFQRFYTYESERSLQAKLDYINEKGLGGLIVWSSAGDMIEQDFPMLTQMAVGLGIYAEEAGGDNGETASPQTPGVTGDTASTNSSSSDGQDSDSRGEENSEERASVPRIVIIIAVAAAMVIGAVLVAVVGLVRMSSKRRK